jgi:hypothetical protein
LPGAAVTIAVVGIVMIVVTAATTTAVLEIAVLEKWWLLSTWLPLQDRSSKSSSCLLFHRSRGFARYFGREESFQSSKRIARCCSASGSIVAVGAVGAAAAVRSLCLPTTSHKFWVEAGLCFFLLSFSLIRWITWWTICKWTIHVSGLKTTTGNALLPV